jgi:ABC-type multidrug transport system fused ATPase/permease subunit
MARALYRKPEILILDEFTSALDADAEQDMIRLVLSLKERGMTLIVISHKLRLVMNADHILLIGERRVAESGTHGELYASGGHYTRFWDQQNGG